MGRFFRSAARLTAIAAILAAVLLAAGYFYLRQSLPQTEGEIRLPGLGAAAEVMRDRYGVPHIFAASLEDASFALGYVHAQDRLWQMEMSRRIAAGRVAELLGAGALETDRFLRTLGVRRSAEANLRVLDAETRRLLDSYAAGVNAFLASGPVLPVEFWLTGAQPEPWTPADSIGWVKMMAWDLGGNFRNELLRMSLARTLPLARIHQILPPYPGEQPPVIADLKELYGTLERDAVQLAQFAPDNDGLGSNNWVVSGARSASGKPLLANDPHLGLTAPPVWYFAHISVPGTNVIGSTLPGVPGIILGRNERIAWGFTNTGPDVQDLYIEKLDAAGGYLAPEGRRPFQVIEETIRVKGAAPEKLRVRVSRHGPVISDVLRTAQDAAPRGHVIAFAWTALAEDDRTMQAALKFARAREWQGFLAAARDFQSPQQNIVYADVEGNIGFVAAGRVPVRKPANDLKGLAPAPGWLEKYDWDGYLPFDQLPSSFNPASGALVTANHRITPPEYAHFISSDWQPPYRADRIQRLLDAAPRHTPQSFARIQADVVSLAMRDLRPRLLATRPRSEEARKALALLGKWDGAMAAGAQRTADRLGVVARADARHLRRRTGRCLPRQLARARRVSRQRPVGRSRARALVRQRAHARGRDLRRGARSFTGGGACRPHQAPRRRPGALALGRGARRAPRAPSVRPPAAARETVRHPRALPRRRLYGERRAQQPERRSAAFRQSPRRQPARDLRPVGPGAVALHPLRRPVGKHLLGPLRGLHRGLGEERVHPDAHCEKNPRRRAASAAAAPAGPLGGTGDGGAGMGGTGTAWL